MDVLTLVPDYVEKPSGGVGEQFRHMMNHLKGRVNYYTVGYPEENSIPNYRSAKSDFPGFPHASLITIYGQSVYFFEALQFKKDFDIIHANDWSTFYAGLLCARHFQKPLICSLHLSLEQLTKSGIFYTHDPTTIDGMYINSLQLEFEHLGLKEADRIIQVSDYYNQCYPQYADKSTVIHNGIDLGLWEPKRVPRLPGKNNTKFCYIGRSSVMKGLDTILAATIPDDVDFYFVVSEKNAEEPLFSKIKEKCNGRNIFHVPGLYGQDKIDFLFTMDAVVMLSVHEPFGIVALESLASNNILVTSASGGIKEVLGDTPYLLVQNTESLEQSFRMVANLSPEERLNVVTKGRERARQFKWSDSANALYDVYVSIL